jgi:hypothetical protein
MSYAALRKLSSKQGLTKKPKHFRIWALLKLDIKQINFQNGE